MKNAKKKPKIRLDSSDNDIPDDGNDENSNRNVEDYNDNHEEDRNNNNNIYEEDCNNNNSSELHGENWVDAGGGGGSEERGAGGESTKENKGSARKMSFDRRLKTSDQLIAEADNCSISVELDKRAATFSGTEDEETSLVKNGNDTTNKITKDSSRRKTRNEEGKGTPYRGNHRGAEATDGLREEEEEQEEEDGEGEYGEMIPLNTRNEFK